MLVWFFSIGGLGVYHLSQNPSVLAALNPAHAVAFIASDKGKMGSVTEGIFSVLSRNSNSATTYFGIPPEQVLELGSQIDL